jgi:hypothetical protein
MTGTSARRGGRSSAAVRPTRSTERYGRPIDACAPAAAGEERGHAPAAPDHPDGVARPHPGGRAVDPPAVDGDVPVHHQPAGLVDGPREAGAQHERVEPALQVRDEQLTGLALPPYGRLEGAPELGLADVVLRLEPLLVSRRSL